MGQQAAWVLMGVLACWASVAWAAAPVQESEPAQRPAATTHRPVEQTDKASSAADPSIADAGINALYYQLQVLQDDVRRLQGIVEEQNHRIERLTREQRERYIELDKRLVELAHPPSAEESVATTPGAGPVLPSTERDSYNAAYLLFKRSANRPASERKEAHQQALAQFKELIEMYPGGDFTPNAFYWSGEIHLEAEELELARQAFVQVVNLFGDHNKVPAALYKLGVVYHRLGDSESALRYLDRVTVEYSSHAAAGLARSYAAEIR